jgi:hypothetical protein
MELADSIGDTLVWWRARWTSAASVIARDGVIQVARTGRPADVSQRLANLRETDTKAPGR